MEKIIGISKHAGKVRKVKKLTAAYGKFYEQSTNHFLSFFTENQKTNQITHQEMSMDDLKHLLGQVMNNRMKKHNGRNSLQDRDRN